MDPIKRLEKDIEDLKRSVQGDEFTGAKGVFARIEAVETSVEMVKDEWNARKIYLKGVAVGLGFVGLVGGANLVIVGRVASAVLGGP